jgi:hypothetical protein
MLTTTEACCKLSPTPPASVARNARQRPSSRKRSTSVLRLGVGTLPWNNTFSMA